MNFEKWWPIAKKADLGDNALAIHVIFRCPFCHTESNFETRGHLINIGQRELLLNWKFSEIIKPKICPVCGIVSGLPEKNKVKLFEDIQTIITTSWLHQKSEEKDPQNPFVSSARFTCSSV